MGSLLGTLLGAGIAVVVVLVLWSLASAVGELAAHVRQPTHRS